MILAIDRVMAGVMADSVCLSNESKKSESLLREAIRILIDSPEKEILEACKSVKKEMLKTIVGAEAIDSFEVSSRIREMDEAFTKFTRIRKLLKDKEKNFAEEAHQAVKSKEEDTRRKALIDEGRRYFQAKAYEKSLNCFESAMVSLQTASEDVLLSAATAAFYAKRFAVAQEYIEEVLFRKPNDAQALVLKALIFIEREKHEYAFELLTKAKKIKPDSKLIDTYLKKTVTKWRKLSKEKNLPSLNSQTESDSHEALRKWKRAPIAGVVRVNTMESCLVTTYPLLSLSAGGCLIEAPHLPDEFQLSIELKDGSNFWAWGNKIYSVGGKSTGVAFRQISREDEKYIDECVNKKLR